MKCIIEKVSKLKKTYKVPDGWDSPEAWYCHKSTTGEYRNFKVGSTLRAFHKKGNVQVIHTLPKKEKKLKRIESDS